MSTKQPKDCVEMNTGQRLVVMICLLIAAAVMGGWAINEIAEYLK